MFRYTLTFLYDDAISPPFVEQEALRRVKRSFKGCLDLDVAGGSSEDEEEDDDANGDSDDELMATATRLSLRCPLGLVSGVFVGLFVFLLLFLFRVTSSIIYRAV